MMEESSASTPFASIDTPALLLDIRALKANIEFLANYFRARHCKLRPHFKSHKCTTIAKMQMTAGAVGITCAKLGEAEVLADAGIRNILIANQIIGPMKIQRLVELARRADVMVAVDSLDNAAMLSGHASAAGVTFGILVEVDVGMGRCGMTAGQPALELARRIIPMAGLRFRGLQGYEGHSIDLLDATERIEKTRAAIELFVGSRRLIEAAGVRVDLVSGGGTGTFDLTGTADGVDELQAGSYACMDWFYGQIRPEFQQAMSILATVISRPRADKIIIDVGRKGTGSEWGPPKVKSFPGCQVTGFNSEEHSTIVIPPEIRVKVGDKIEIIPSHGCTTSNLHSEFVVYDERGVIDRWPIEGRGKLQ